MGDVHRGHSQDSLTLGTYDLAAADDDDTASSTSTGDATDNDHDHDGGRGEEEEAEEENSVLPPLIVSGSLLGPQSVPHSAVTEATRSSYTTNDTGTASRISGLSDFPVPPNQTVVSIDRVQALKSYFGSDAHEQVPAGQESPGPSRPSRERAAGGEPELQ